MFILLPSKARCCQKNVRGLSVDPNSLLQGKQHQLTTSSFFMHTGAEPHPVPLYRQPHQGTGKIAFCCWDLAANMVSASTQCKPSAEVWFKAGRSLIRLFIADLMILYASLMSYPSVSHGSWLCLMVKPTSYQPARVDCPVTNKQYYCKPLSPCTIQADSFQIISESGALTTLVRLLGGLVQIRAEAECSPESDSRTSVFISEAGEDYRRMIFES